MFSIKNLFGRTSHYQKPSYPIPEVVWQDPIYFIAFGFGSGTLPLAPGTFGTLMAIPFYLLIRPFPFWSYVAITIAFILISAWLCQIVTNAILIEDHPGMCLDEFAGFFVTMINAPPGVEWIILGFLLFRFFDIVKPWPIRLMDEHLKGGLGMILDDVMAGIYSFLIMQILSFLFKTV